MDVSRTNQQIRTTAPDGGYDLYGRGDAVLDHVKAVARRIEDRVRQVSGDLSVTSARPADLYPEPSAAG